MFWVDSCITCSVNIIIQASFQLKTLVRYIFLLSITIDYYRWKIYFHYHYHYRSKSQLRSSLTKAQPPTDHTYFHFTIYYFTLKTCSWTNFFVWIKHQSSAIICHLCTVKIYLLISKYNKKYFKQCLFKIIRIGLA